MTTRLHAIGFPADWSAPDAQPMRQLAAESRTVTSPKGHYRCWRSRDGAELWFHYPAASSAPAFGFLPRTDAEGLIGGEIVTPFHRGQSSVTIRVGRVLAQDRRNPLEGACLAWLPKPESGGRERAITLELVPFARHVFRPSPFITKAQITCFTHSVWAFDSERGYISGTPENRRVPLGGYWPVNEADVPDVKLSYRTSPVTLGLACGLVRRSIRLINPVTGEPYYWLALETRRAVFDVLANPASVQGDISAGNIALVCGSFLARLEGTPV